MIAPVQVDVSSERGIMVSPMLGGEQFVRGIHDYLYDRESFVLEVREELDGLSIITIETAGDDGLKIAMGQDELGAMKSIMNGSICIQAISSDPSDGFFISPS